MYSRIARRIREVVEILKGLGYYPEKISSKEFHEYMTGETPAGDTITLEDVLCNEFFMVHEVVEISELKKDECANQQANDHKILSTSL